MIGSETIKVVYQAWRNSCVIDSHATARGSIPDGNDVKNELHVLHKGQEMGLQSPCVHRCCCRELF